MSSSFKKKRGNKPIRQTWRSVEAYVISRQRSGYESPTDSKEILSRAVTKWKNGNMVTCTMSEVSKKTARNYNALVSNSSREKYIWKVSHKSGTRHTAEKSLMSTVCYLIIVAFSHFFVGNTSQLYHKCTLRDAT